MPSCSSGGWEVRMASKIPSNYDFSGPMCVLKSLLSNPMKKYHRDHNFVKSLLVAFRGISIGNLGIKKSDKAKMLYFPSNIFREYQGTTWTLE